MVQLSVDAAATARKKKPRRAYANRTAIKSASASARRAAVQFAECVVSAPAYEADAGDRIVAALAREKVAGLKRLTPAARLAGRQLEWLMPVIIGHACRGRLIAGKFTQTVPGVMVFILADEKRVATIHVLDQPDMVDRIIEGARVLREFIAEGNSPLHSAVASVIGFFLDEYGGDPGAATKPASAVTASRMVALLFAGFPDEQARQLLDEARESATFGLAPAFIALRGPGAKPSTMAGIWPLLLHLAPYFDSAPLADTQETGRA
jgi:hypothetical protein